MSAKLTEKEREAALAELPGWEAGAGGDAISRSFSFDDFTEAFAFMTRAALWAEKWDHHPDWSNAYNKVNVTLTTHDAGGLTERDMRLARKLDEIADSAERRSGRHS